MSMKTIPSWICCRNTGLFRFIYRAAEQFPKKKYKNMFNVDPLYMDELKRFITERDYPRVQFVASEPHLLEMLPEGVSKANAIDELCRYLKLDSANVYAVGTTTTTSPCWAGGPQRRRGQRPCRGPGPRRPGGGQLCRGRGGTAHRAY